MNMDSITLRHPGRRRGRLPRFAGAALAAVAVAAALTATDTVAHAEDSVPSAGCGVAAPQAGTSTPQFAAAGKSGHYILDVPAGADRPTPVVLDLHGYLEAADIHHSASGFGEYGSTHGFITVTPALDEPGLPRWDFSPGSVDIDYLSQLLTHVESTLCVDKRRIFAAGLSMGGFTSSSLACQLSDRIAAVAPVAGLQSFDWCRPTRPVPVVGFHGTTDPIIAYTGGRGPNARFLPSPDGSWNPLDTQDGGPKVNGPGPRSIPDNLADWARRNGCGGTSTQRPVTPDVDLIEYSCPATGTAELYAIRGGGHTWPGSNFATPEILTGTTATSINATQIIWDFFQAHPLPR